MLCPRRCALRRWSSCRQATWICCLMGCAVAVGLDRKPAASPAPCHHLIRHRRPCGCTCSAHPGHHGYPRLQLRPLGGIEDRPEVSLPAALAAWLGRRKPGQPERAVACSWGGCDCGSHTRLACMPPLSDGNILIHHCVWPSAGPLQTCAHLLALTMSPPPGPCRPPQLPPRYPAQTLTRPKPTMHPRHSHPAPAKPHAQPPGDGPPSQRA
jgi:hypothetical protein